MTRFGPAGNSESFTTMGYKNSLQVPIYLEKMGLSAFEYQCGRGVKISQQSAEKLGNAAKEKDIRISLHAPYFISMSSTDEEKRMGSLRYITESATAVNHMQGDRIIVHTGSCGSISREYAMELATDTMKAALAALDDIGLSHIHICPEVMGKTNQLGTLEEVLLLCKIDERLIPCIDFGHLNARTFGGLKTMQDFADVFDLMENAVGIDRAKTFHAHFSKIEYTPKGGEKKHLTFADTVYGPQFEPVSEQLAKRGYNATIICESAGTQAEDAATMQAIYLTAKENVQ